STGGAAAAGGRLWRLQNFDFAGRSGRAFPFPSTKGDGFLLLGGFVIFGDRANGLERCIESLRAVCDVVVAIHTGKDASIRDLAKSRGVELDVVPWRGFGAARARAVEILGDADYLFYLDSDEWLEQPARRQILGWKGTGPSEAFYRLRLRDWIISGQHRKVFRTEWRRRLVRRDAALWRDDMIVHESLPGPRGRRLGGFIEHAFASDPGLLSAKLRKYALLWAIGKAAHGQSTGSAAGRYLASFARNAFLKGALFRCGIEGLRYSACVARYHRDKHRFLRMLRAGHGAGLVAAAREGRLEELFGMLAAVNIPEKLLSISSD
ncbi:MAG: hypothetical protein D6806_11445, partial [Deltaproteobacteria bacterium]